MRKNTIQKSDTNVSKPSIQVKHYSNVFADDSSHWQMTKDFGETNTDRSTYKPSVSLVRAFLGSGGNSRKTFLYDYPDGKDDGQTIKTFLRQPGLDITEVETAEKVMTTIIQDKKNLDESTAKSEKAQKDIIDAIKAAGDALSGNSSTSSTSATPPTSPSPTSK